jgi:hypothetical protein
MSGDKLMFDEFITLCDEQYEYGLIEFKNGDITNGPGENDGSAKVLSYAALAEFDKEMTLKVSCCYCYSRAIIACSCVRSCICGGTSNSSDAPAPSSQSHLSHHIILNSCNSFGDNTTEMFLRIPAAMITRTFAIS